MSLRVSVLVASALALLMPLPAKSARAGRIPVAAPESAPCVDVRIGTDSSGRMDCLNRALRDEVGRVAPTNTGDAASGMAASALGQPTPAALKQRYGNAYGHSLVPQRPARTFAPPLPPVH